MTIENFLTTHEAAALLRVSEHTLRSWRASRAGPRFIKIGGTVRYRRDDLDEYIELGVVEPENRR